jgi:hypothetical protein
VVIEEPWCFLEQALDDVTFEEIWRGRPALADWQEAGRKLMRERRLHHWQELPAKAT